MSRRLCPAPISLLSRFSYELMDMAEEITIGETLVITLRISTHRLKSTDWIGIYSTNVPSIPGNSIAWQYITKDYLVDDDDDNDEDNNDEDNNNDNEDDDMNKKKKNERNKTFLKTIVFTPEQLPKYAGDFDIRIHLNNSYQSPELRTRFTIIDARKSPIKRTTFFILLISLVAGFQQILNARGVCYYMSPLYSKDVIFDYFVYYTTTMNQHLADNDELAELVQAITSFFIDTAILLLIFLGAVKRSSSRPFLSLFLVMTFRFIAQSIAILPCPVGFLWPSGKVLGVTMPTIFVDYSPSNDLFFSGHASTMLIVTIELFKMNYYRLGLLYLFILFPFVSISVVTFRAHRGIDIMCAIFASISASSTSKYISVVIDNILTELRQQ